MKSLMELMVEGVVENNIDAICNKLQLDFKKVKFTKEDLIKGIWIELKHFGVIHRNIFRASIKAIKNLSKNSNCYKNTEIEDLHGIDDIVADNSYTEMY